MSPNGGGQPSGDLADAINSTFGSFEEFKTAFSNAAATVWLRLGLVVRREWSLSVCSTPNQDNPL